MLVFIELTPSDSLTVTDCSWFNGGVCNGFTSRVEDVVCCDSLA